MYKTVVKMLEDRGVMLREIAEVVYEIQKSYYDSLPLEECLESVEAVVKKREVQNAILTGLALDMLAEEGKLPEPLQSIVAGDDFLFGVDEIVALSITNIYGSIGLTNFGYLDKTKPLVIGRLNSHKNGGCHTFLDDLVSAIAAAAASRIAHARRPSNNED
ncbi:phosphatidylglycerophosphatase A family protein [Symbiobacterium thermophilum]|uniref:Putative low temperature requirement C protein n=1 Tax=Symbiobacterium thermophilum (strain DSM 24528 / JCM 14929 / IAM 14863 / T) TaxID=292459 RepID=Q67RK8_SYMTH|nr:phosphatidylglycerophosphatase A [Symbiobacterium thermophilum]BAD39685.1 putative low temperature requirement C protein [Symbiobacterium thermophilum IAM 14863]